MENLSILPTGVQTALESWKQDLEAILGDRLISAIIYDGLVKNDDAKDTDGNRVMLVMSEMSVEILTYYARYADASSWPGNFSHSF